MTGGEKLHLFGEYVLDTARGCLLRAGRPVHLRPQAYKALKFLTENRGRLVSKDRLIEQVWEGRAVTDDSLVQCLRDVRQALGEGGGQYLRNERGRGYIFDPEAGEWSEQIDVLKVVVEEEEEEEATAPTVLPPAATDGSLGPVRATGSGRALGLTAVCLLVVGLMAGAAYYFRWPDSGKPADATGVRSLAVLPFKPLVPEGREEALEVGMADTLIAKLGNIGEVTVRPLSAVRRYAGLEQDPLAAGRQLGVDAVLDGTIQRSGDRVGVTARLVSVGDGRQLWEGRFDAQFTDIFSVQDAISEKVVAALALRLTGEEQKQLTRHYTENTEAYRMNLYGRFYRNKRTEAGMKMALEYYDGAIAKDQNYALAYAGLSEAYIGLSVFGAMPPKEVCPRAGAAALKALEIDDGMAESHVALAHFKNQCDRDWSGTETEYQRAIELNSGYADAYRLYAILLMEAGREDEAFAKIKRALEIDPTSVIYNATFGFLYYWARRYDQAIEQLRKTIDIDQGHWLAHYWLAQAYAQKGMNGEALLEAQKARGLSGDSGSLWVVGYVHAVGGRRAEAQQQIDELLKLSKQRYIPPYDIAQVYAGLGDKDQAFAWLEKADEDRSRGMDYLNVNPVFETLRSDPRFAALAKRMGRE